MSCFYAIDALNRVKGRKSLAGAGQRPALFVFAGVLAGVSPLHPTRGYNPLDPTLKVSFFNLTHPE
jgi:hypothetical protein